MKILIIGSGGREHALAWRVRQDDPLAKLYIAPGNAGTASLGNNVPITATDLPALLEWAQKNRPDLTIVGPEAPLCAGLVDQFEAQGLAVFGPRAAAARLEGSKLFTKEFLLRNNIPTAKGAGFTDPLEAYAYSQTQPYPQVIKANGLAAGKGVVIAKAPAEATQAIYKMMEERVFGPAGETILIEEFLVGREMSLHVLTDGISFQILPIAQDHKRLGDLDTGPNTGGMGAYAPVPFATPALIHELSKSIVEPTLAAFRDEKIDFRGVLFIGLVLTLEGPKVLEFNVRLGDPETQAILPLLESPLIELLQAVRNRELASAKLKIHENRHVVSIVLASGGYPEKLVTGAVINGLEQNVADTVVFHSGTSLEETKTVTAGGRVLSVTGWAMTLAHARELAYQRASLIRYEGRQLRHDIAARTTLD